MLEYEKDSVRYLLILYSNLAERNRGLSSGATSWEYPFSHPHEESALAYARSIANTNKALLALNGTLVLFNLDSGARVATFSHRKGPFIEEVIHG